MDESTIEVIERPCSPSEAALHHKDREIEKRLDKIEAALAQIREMVRQMSGTAKRQGGQ